MLYSPLYQNTLRELPTLNFACSGPLDFPSYIVEHHPDLNPARYWPLLIGVKPYFQVIFAEKN